MDVSKNLISLAVALAIGVVAPFSAAAKKLDENDSVHRWGRWAVLSPAAGGEEAAAFPVAANEIGRCEAGANCPGIQLNSRPQPPEEPPPEEPPVEPPVEPPQPPEATSPCEAGMPCGFARVDTPYDPAAEVAPEESRIESFSVQFDHENGQVAFAVAPGEEGEIQSETVPAVYTAFIVESEEGFGSDLRGTLTRDGARPVVSQGLWSDTVESDEEQSELVGGEYVWGITATAEDLQQLAGDLGGETIAVYDGLTMGAMNGSEGAVRLEVDFDAAEWSGDFDGAVAFSASGEVVGSGFVSDADGFSSNIATGDVKGGFVNAGHTAIGSYDVTDNEGLKDVDIFRADLQTETVR